MSAQAHFVKNICDGSILLNMKKDNYAFYFLLYKYRIGFVQIFDFRFLMDLHVFGCSEHDLTISGNCRSVCMIKILWQV